MNKLTLDVLIFIQTWVVAGMALFVAMMWRNMRVYRFRGRLIDQMYQMSRQDILNRRPFTWRHEVYDKVSYHAMMYKFWRPLEPKAWWEDIAFLEEQK